VSGAARIAALQRVGTSASERDWHSLLVGAGTATFVVALASSQGGYFPATWGWAAALLLVPTSLAWAIGSGSALSRWRIAAILVVGGLGLWTALSIIWSVVPDQSVLEAERALLYVAAVLAAATFLRPGRIEPLVAGILVGSVAVSSYSLSTRLFPNRLGVFDPVGVYRLAEPIGYWNALGLFVTIALLLALIFTARGARLWGRCASAATMPVLLATLYFTFGRSAWISLGAAVAAALILDPRRLQLAAVLMTVAPACVVTVVVCERAHALTHHAVPLAAATHDGHHVAAIVVGLCLVAAAMEAIRSMVAERAVFGRTIRMAFGGACLMAVALLIATPVIVAGGPVKLAEKAKATFVAPPGAQGDLNRRLISFSGNGRATLWHAAWQDARAHPLLGAGAGSYERWWLAHRPTALKVRDAHDLYLETLAELGPIGLLLVVSMLGIPLLAGVRARRSPLVPGIVGAIVAYAVHASADWDWEVSVLGVMVIGLGMAAVAAAEETQPVRRVIGAPGRVAVAIVTAALSIAAIGGLAGNRAAAASDNAAANSNWASAAQAAEKARRWLPWSPRPWTLLGEAQLGAGDTAAARTSFARAIAKDAGDWNAWLDAARAAKDPAQRRRDLRRASSLNPKSPEIAAFEQTIGQG
jgi:hypothetical protein